MGGVQMKCSCGEFSSVEVIATCNANLKEKILQESVFTDVFDKIAAKSGYPGWSTSDFSTYKAYPCQKCADEIGDNLDETNDFDYEMLTSKTGGYWRTDLP